MDGYPQSVEGGNLPDYIPLIVQTMMEVEVGEMSQPEENSANARKPWCTPQLEQLTVDLTAIAGNSVPCGDNGKFNGKSLPCS